MAVFENFPYTNFHEMNQDFLIKAMKETEETVADTLEDVNAKIEEFEGILENGPVTDVKTWIAGDWQSIKDNDGVATIPRAGTNVSGTVYLGSDSNRIELVGSGAPLYAARVINGQLPASLQPPKASTDDWGLIKLEIYPEVITLLLDNNAMQDVPRVDNGKISNSLLPVTDVQQLVSGSYQTVVDANGVAKLPITPPASMITSGVVKLYTNTGDHTVNIIGSTAHKAAAVDENGTISADVIPDSGVTAGTYGALHSIGNAYDEYPIFSVDDSGRITSASTGQVPHVNVSKVTIAAGSTTATYNVARDWPRDNNYSWANIVGFTQVASGSTLTVTPLVLGTDFTWSTVIDTDTGVPTITITLLQTLSTPAYFRIIGTYVYRTT